MLGVLRVTEKCGNGIFTETDQESLNTLATVAIAPKLGQLLNRQADPMIKVITDRIDSVVTSFAMFTSDWEFRDTFMSAWSAFEKLIHRL